MSESNIDAIFRLRAEPGWTGIFVREQAPGAWPNGARVSKVLEDASGDRHPPGSTGTVLGSLGPSLYEIPVASGVIPPGAYFYFIEWDEHPRLAVGCGSNKLGLIADD